MRVEDSRGRVVRHLHPVAVVTFAARLRRLLHRPPTVQDCLDAVHAVRRLVPPERYEEMTVDYRKMIAAAPCEPTRAPAGRIDPMPDPYKPVVSGPGLVERTRQSREQHLDRFRDDEGWENLGLIWSEFVEPTHDTPLDGAA